MLKISVTKVVMLSKSTETNDGTKIVYSPLSSCYTLLLLLYQLLHKGLQIYVLVMYF